MLKIPDEYIGGFKGLIDLDSERFDSVINFIESESNILDIDKFRFELENLITGSNNKEISEVIISLASLKNAYPAKDLSSAISESFFNKIDKGSEKNKILSDRVEAILKVSKRLTQYFKREKLLSSNPNLIKRTDIVSDIRLVFDEILESSDREAIILHQLKIDYLDGQSMSSEMFFTLKQEDLIELRDTVNRALAKEKTILNDYKDVVRFLD